MSDPILGILGFVVLFGLIILRIPVAIAMLFTGFYGGGLLIGWEPMLTKFYNDPYHLFASYPLSVIPFFLLMGMFAARGGLSADLFNLMNSLLGHRKGGVAMASVCACAGFGAVCGSSLATATTIGRIALPEMRRLNYAPAFAGGVLAAGGTLGILIPPSVVLVVYSIVAEQNLIKLFVAAVGPALLSVIAYLITIGVYIRLRPGSAPKTEKSGGKVRLRHLRSAWHIALIFFIVLGGIYGGIFTPTEAAAIGACLAAILAFCLKRMNWRSLLEGLKETAVTTASVYLIILGAQFFGAFLSLSGLPIWMTDWVGQSNLSPYIILILILAAYILLGCIMESLSMLLITMPLFFPAIMSLDFGMSPEETALWFGILALMVVETGLITPPMGMNTLLINSFTPQTPVSETFKGVLPFILTDIIRTGILIATPAVTLAAVRLLW